MFTVSLMSGVFSGCVLFLFRVVLVLRARPRARGGALDPRTPRGPDGLMGPVSPVLEHEDEDD